MYVIQWPEGHQDTDSNLYTGLGHLNRFKLCFFFFNVRENESFVSYFFLFFTDAAGASKFFENCSLQIRI
jgi:hypothetical protein